jgi:HEAT repeat protein
MKNDNLPDPVHYKGVMVSSTFTDLIQHRTALIKAISGQELKPVVMENDSAKPDLDVIDSSFQMVRDASAYVGVVSHKYGQIPESSDRNLDRLSLTELEFNEARRLGRPVLLFIMGDDHDVKPGDVEKDPEKIRKLETFRENAKRVKPGSSVHRVYKVFNSLREFEVAANQSIASLRRYLDALYPAPTSGTERTSRQSNEVPEIKYAKWLKQHSQRVSKLFLDHMLRSEGLHTEQLSERYIELFVKETPSVVGKKKSEEDQTDEAPWEGPLSPFIDKPGVKCLVMGEGGTGKTTTLLKIAADFAKRAHHDLTAKIPVYVKLNLFNAKVNAFNELIEKISSYTKLNEHETKEFIINSPRPILFLLDGFNEVAQEFQQTCVLALQELIQRGSESNSYIITSRPTDVANKLAAQIPGVKILEIELLTDSQVQEFLTERGVAEVFDQMNERLKGLSRNPFLLWALTQSCTEFPVGQMPKNIGQLYKAFIDDYIFKKRERLKEVSTTRYNYEHVKKPVLAELAYYMTNQGSTHFSCDDISENLLDWLETEIEKSKRRKKVVPIDWTTDEFIEEVIENGLFRRIGDYLEFMHQSVQEYFTAMKMVSWINEKDTDRILQHVPPLIWHQVKLSDDSDMSIEHPFGMPIIMSFGIVTENSFLLKTLADYNPIYAAYCIYGAQQVNKRVRNILIKDWLGLLKRRHERYRWIACQCLGHAMLEGSDVIEKLIDSALNDESNAVQMAAARALGKSPSKGTARSLVKKFLEAYFEDDNKDNCPEILDVVNSPVTIELLFKVWMNQKEKETIRTRAEHLLANMNRRTVKSELQRILNTAIRNCDVETEREIRLALKEMDSESWKKMRTNLNSLRLNVDEIIYSARRISKIKEDTLKAFSSKSVDELIRILNNDNSEFHWYLFKILCQRKASKIIETLFDFYVESDLSLEDSADLVLLIRTTANNDEIAKLFIKWQKIFSHVKTTKQKIRSKAIALAPIFKERAITYLSEAINDSEPNIRIEAARVLGKIKGKKAVVALTEQLRTEESDSCREAIINSLGETKSENAISPLIEQWELLGSIDIANEWQLQSVVKKAKLLSNNLRKIEAESQFIEILTKAIKDKKSITARLLAAKVMLEWMDFDEKTMKLVQEGLKDNSTSVRETLVTKLGELKSEESLSILVNTTLFDPDKNVQQVAAKNLKWFEGDSAVKSLILSLKSPDKIKRIRGAQALGLIEDEAAVRPLLELLNDKVVSVRIMAATALNQIKYDNVDRLIQILISIATKAVNFGDREKAANALKSLPNGIETLYAPIKEALSIKNYKQLIELVGEKLRYLPEDINLYYWRGIAYYQLNEFRKALADWGQVTKLGEHFAEVHILRAEALKKLNQKRAARDALKEALKALKIKLELYPKRAELQSQVASISSELNRHKAALAAARKTAELQSDNAESHLNLGWYAYKASEYDESITASKKALELDKKLQIAAFNLGLALVASGKIVQSKKAYKQALEICTKLDLNTARLNIDGAFNDLRELGKSKTVYKSDIEDVKDLIMRAYNQIKKTRGNKKKDEK